MCTNNDSSDGKNFGYSEIAEKGGESEETANCCARGHGELPSTVMYDLVRKGT
jgi:hypothetical protein